MCKGYESRACTTCSTSERMLGRSTARRLASFQNLTRPSLPAVLPRPTPPSTEVDLLGTDAFCSPPVDTLAHCSTVMRHGRLRVGRKGVQQLYSWSASQPHTRPPVCRKATCLPWVGRQQLPHHHMNATAQAHQVQFSAAPIQTHRTPLRPYGIYT